MFVELFVELKVLIIDYAKVIKYEWTLFGS
jgi:hypothetical protein